MTSDTKAGLRLGLNILKPILMATLAVATHEATPLISVINAGVGIWAVLDAFLQESPRSRRERIVRESGDLHPPQVQP